MLSSLSLLAIWLDPSDPARFTSLAYALLGAYVVYALIVALLVRREAVPLGRLQVATLVVDLAVFALIVYLTEGPASPFLVFSVFILSSAALRWQWRGILGTAGALIVTFGGVTLVNARPFGYSTVEFDHAMIRVVQLLVVAWLLVFLGAYATRLRRDLARLASWSREVTVETDREPAYGRMLAQTAAVMGVPRVLWAWEQAEEPWLRLAFWENDRMDVSQAAPTEYAPVVDTQLLGLTFVCSDARNEGNVQSAGRRAGELTNHRCACVHRALAERFRMGALVSAPVNAGAVSGRLFFLDRAHLSADDLALAEVVARGWAELLIEHGLRARVREAAAFEERVRLAGDLHDGVLQSLTGASIQLEIARRLLPDDTKRAEQIIAKTQRALAREQRNVRSLVEALKPTPGESGEVARGLAVCLQEVGEAVTAQWSLDAQVVLGDGGAVGPAADALADDVCLIVHEGLVNSARHARANWARATIQGAADRMEVVLEDDGQGFGFVGRRDADALGDLGIGPVSLMTRVRSLGGTLTVDSSPAGSRIAISLPLPLAVGGGSATAVMPS